AVSPRIQRHPGGSRDGPEDLLREPVEVTEWVVLQQHVDLLHPHYRWRPTRRSVSCGIGFIHRQRQVRKWKRMTWFLTTRPSRRVCAGCTGSRSPPSSSVSGSSRCGCTNATCCLSLA